MQKLLSFTAREKLPHCKNGIVRPRSNVQILVKSSLLRGNGPEAKIDDITQRPIKHQETSGKSLKRTSLLPANGILDVT